MVGAQKAMKIASNFFPDKKSTSETIIMDTTTNSIMQFIRPIRSIKFLNIVIMDILLKGIIYSILFLTLFKFFLTLYDNLTNCSDLIQIAKIKVAFFDEYRLLSIM